MAFQTPKALIQTADFATWWHPVARNFVCVGEIVQFAFGEVGMEHEEIEAYNHRVILMCKPRASIFKTRLINCIRGTLGRLYPLPYFVGPVIAPQKDANLTYLQLLEQIYAPTCRVPDLNYPPLGSLTTEELVSLWKKENAQLLSVFAEGCLIRVGMLNEAQDFKDRVEAAGAAFEDFDSVKLWNYFTLPYKMRKELVAAGMIEVPEIVELPPPNAIFPTPQSIGWKPELMERASKAVTVNIEDDGCSGKRKAPTDDADEAGPSSLKKKKTVLEVTSSCGSN